MNMLKKVAVFFSIFFLVLNNSSLLVYAAAPSIKINFVLLDWSSSTTILKKNPWDLFRLWTRANNNWDVDLTAPKYKVFFPDNTLFTYNWYITNTATNWRNIPANEFTSSWIDSYTDSSLSAATLIPSVSTSQISLWDTSTNKAFQLKSTISRYQNDLTVKICGTYSATEYCDTQVRTVYANVKPYITDFYFVRSWTSNTTTSIKNNWFDAVDLVLQVKDYNINATDGCSNLSNGQFTANLSSLMWEWATAVPLTYDSCDTSTKTATFKKTAITTLQSVWSLSFGITNFSWKDADNNFVDSAEPNFANENKLTSLTFSITPTTTPNVIFTSNSNSYLGPYRSTTTISFSGDQTWSYQVKVWSLCDTSWTWTAYNTTWSTINANVDYTSLSSWANTVYLCVKNSIDEIGSYSLTLTRDEISPTASNLSFWPSSVNTENVSFSYRCSENWTYQVEVGGIGVINSWLISTNGSVIANQLLSDSILNANLSNWSNTVYFYCLDRASNYYTMSWTVIKWVPTAPSMTGETVTLTDIDSINEWLDGRDIQVTWSTWALSWYTYFDSYLIYILPSNIALDVTWHSWKWAVWNINTWIWTWSSSITTDSTNTPFVNWAQYIAYVLAVNSNWKKWSAWASSASTLNQEIITDFNLNSAKFTSTWELTLVSSIAFSWNASAYTLTWITYNFNWTNYNPTSVKSISNKTIVFNITNLWNTSATWTLSIITWALVESGGWMNSLINTWISDGISPAITNFATWTSSLYQTFYWTGLRFSWNSSEILSGWWKSYIRFFRSWGSSDSNDHRYYLLNSSHLTWWSINFDIDFSQQDSMSTYLVNGSYYDVSLVALDNIGNTTVTTLSSSIKYDSVWPDAPTLSTFAASSSTTPSLSWSIPNDNWWFWAWVKNYLVKIYNWTGCLSSVNQSGTVTVTWYNVNTLTNWNYSWTVVAYDNLNNTWTLSSCSNFIVDTTLPQISNQKITDTTINSTFYSKTSDLLQVSASITNTDTNHIWLDMSSLAGSTNYNFLKCADAVGSVSCSYSAWVVTYSFAAWFSWALTQWVRQVQFTSSNSAGLNTWTALTFITVDNAAPTVGPVITAPISSSTWWGSSQNITWTTSWITDNIWVTYIKLEYSTWTHTSWVLIGTWSNSSPYIWNVSSIPSGSDYQVKLTAYDWVWNSSSTTSQTFIIDKTPPTVWSSVLTIPNGGSVYSWWQSLAVTWNSAWITDNIALATSPISLQYSTDAWSTWTSIISSQSNNWSYNWTVPSMNTTQWRVRLIATDNASNTWSDISDSNFIIDSIVPSQTITYAGGGGSTPVNGKYINTSGLQASLSSIDNYLDKVYYRFQNVTDSQYWDQSGNWWTGTSTWNVICTDSTSLWTDWNCWNITSSIVPSSIATNKQYRLVFKSVDEGWNTTTSNPLDYSWDVTVPNISITNASWSYFSWSLTINGTASDSNAWLSSVKIEIKKWSSWWNGSAWVGTQQILSTTTSNSYANWSYQFNAPWSDSDWQSYTITATAYDNAYQVSNSSTASINVIKDTVWPSIASSVFTFNTSTYYTGWSVLNITWNPWDISSTWAWLASNPIRLQYNFTWVVNTIASNLANNWTYSFTLPTVDTTTAKIIISAVDSVGNLSSSVTSSNFTIDSTPPSVSTVETMDTDADWQIDWLLLTFSENIQDSTVNPANFAIASWISISSFDTAVNPNDNIIKLNFANTWNTATRPILSYTQWTLVDNANNKLVSFSNRVATDTSVPRISTAELYDSNSNWKVDLIKVYFSENMQSSVNTSAWSINNAMAGLSIASAWVTNNIINLNLSEPTNIDTTTGGMTVTFVSNSNWIDWSSNQAASLSNINLLDKALPRFVSATTFDLNWNFKVDKIVLNLSESVTWFASNNFALNWLSAWSSVSSSSLNWSQITFDIAETSNDNDTSLTWNISYTPWSLQDLSSNLLSSYSIFVITDWVAPKIVSRETKDSDWNGKIDKILLTYSEPVNNVFTWFTALVDGYVVNGYNWTSSSSTSDILLTELSIYDSNATPQVQIFSNSTLKDLNGNLLASEGSSTASVDKVWPVIIGARFDEWNSKLYLTFSENVNEWLLTTSSFVLSGAWTSTISSVSIWTSWDVYADLDLTSPTILYGTSSVSFATNTAWDLNLNKQSLTSYAKISASVVINEIMWANTWSSVNQYVELRNLSSSSININGWILKNAGWNGIDITLPNVSISWNGYYLIAKSASSSSLLNITPDLVNSTLSLSTWQNNLILMNWSVIVDTATIFSSKWDNNTPKSAERLSNPWDWTLTSNWYTAEFSSWFDDNTPKWTPWSQNVFDGYAPNISWSTPSSDLLFPIWSLTVSFNYSDNTGWVWIDITSRSFQLQKYLSGSWRSWLNLTYVTSSWADTSSSYYNLSGLPYWKYRAIFNIKDNASNTSSNEIVQFYIDQFEYTITNTWINLWTLQVWSDVISTTWATLTIKTLGAGYNIFLSHTGMYAWTALISNYANWSWFGYNYTWASINIFTWNTLFISSPKNYTWSNWIQNTYTYTIKYWAHIDNMQPAWIYRSIVSNKIWLDY